MRNGFELWQ